MGVDTAVTVDGFTNPTAGMAVLTAIVENGWDISVRRISARHGPVTTGLIFNVAALIALVLSVGAFALNHAGFAVGAGITALFSFGASLACFSDGRPVQG